jgi:hypothetical protein
MFHKTDEETKVLADLVLASAIDAAQQTNVCVKCFLVEVLRGCALTLGANADNIPDAQEVLTEIISEALIEGHQIAVTFNTKEDRKRAN